MVFRVPSGLGGSSAIHGPVQEGAGTGPIDTGISRVEKRHHWMIRYVMNPLKRCCFWIQNLKTIHFSCMKNKCRFGGFPLIKYSGLTIVQLYESLDTWCLVTALVSLDNLHFQMYILWCFMICTYCILMKLWDSASMNENKCHQFSFL